MGEQEGHVLFNDTLNTFYMASGTLKWRERKCDAATTRTTLSDTSYHALCYTSRGTLAGMRNNDVGLPRGLDPTTRRTTSRSTGGGTVHRPMDDTRYC